MKKMFTMEKSPACEYCHYGRMTADGSAVLCEKKGIMQNSSSCRKFKYDVLKRRPRKQASIDTNYSADDFKL